MKIKRAQYTTEVRGQKRSVEICSGDAGFRCSHCKKYQFIKMHIKQETEYIDYEAENQNMNEDYNHFYSWSINIRCNTCGEMNYLQRYNILDPNMVRILEILNSDNLLTTTYSCEGHTDIKEMGYSSPYIAFDVISSMTVKMLIKKYPLPNGWYIDDNDFNGMLYIRYKCFHFTDTNIVIHPNWKRKCYKPLEKWAQVIINDIKNTLSEMENTIQEEYK